MELGCDKGTEACSASCVLMLGALVPQGLKSSCHLCVRATSLHPHPPQVSGSALPLWFMENHLPFLPPALSAKAQRTQSHLSRRYCF